jgi:hypothetical protein
MKKILLVASIFMTVSVASVYASFPVKSENETSVVTEQITNDKQELSTPATHVDSKVKVSKSEMKKMKKSSNAPMSRSDKEMLTLILFLVFLGWAAAHRWYAGKPVGWNILFILTAGGCGIWAIVDLINIIKGDF